jgi:hypothetical protein
VEGDVNEDELKSLTSGISISGFSDKDDES